MGCDKMKKVLSVIFALAIVLTALSVQSFAKSDKVEIYGNKVSVHTKQICFVKGEKDSLSESLYDSSFKKYYYAGNETVDFKVVAEKLPELQNLVVIRSDVKNLSALGDMKDLVWLGLHQCGGSENLSFLKNLTGLKKFRYTNIYGKKECESIKPVAYLKNLTELQINVKQSVIDDITPLKGLTKLQKLDLRYVGGEDVSVIKNFSNLKELELKLSEPTSMTFLVSLRKLEKLDISGKTKNLSVAVKLKKLKDLSIDSTNENLSFIGEMTGLEKLSLSYVNRSFAKTAGNLTGLKELTLIDVNDGNRYDMSFLSELTSLENLFILGQHGLDITGISKLKKLKSISIWLCGFDDLSELKKCTALEDLVIYNNNSPFDVKWISGTNIKDLRISGGGNAGVENMEKLATLKDLEYLLMDFTGIPEETAKKIKKAVPKCKIEVCELKYGDYETVFY